MGGQWEPRTDGEDDERDDGERNRHCPRHHSQHRDAAFPAQREGADVELAAGSQRDERQRSSRNRAERLHLVGANQPEPTGSDQETDDEITDNAWHPQPAPLRDPAAQIRGE